ncbi:Eukaryotic initiation factor 4E family protein [Tritrichomonas foetus]|uniref:Eukaryotic initiation factor 4E family protein n=1 Tax=Tritrichomonas foetus TaxID=1144522 RepID=A0A1J4KYE6_9EUKA|nr:Eukaryotic initiation factor 4E family protein [Tritrichomonas foetus]|eukprot:OHT15904.1 Eukaryotic initiation factor 4E family protein [Tritrichomonas foetus]
MITNSFISPSMIEEPIMFIPPQNDKEIDTIPRAGAWIFWYLIPNRSGNVLEWKVHLHPLHSFDSIEDFLRLINSIEHPSKLMKGCRFYVFRSFSKPLWEHETVSNGHIISIEIEKDQIQADSIAEKWIDLVQQVLEDTSAENLSILGVEYYSKPHTWKISLWISRSCENLEDVRGKMETMMNIGTARISEVIQDTM